MRNWTTAVSITISMIGLSVLLHSPFTNPSLYTDILGFFWNDFASKNRIPYFELDESGGHFEYPFVSGVLSILAWKAGGDLAGFYAVYSGMVAASALAMAYAMMRLHGNNSFWTYLVSPSLVVYGVYGYDVFLAALTALAVLSFTRERYSLSAILLALAFHTKLLSILFLPYALLRLDGRHKLKYLTVFGLVAGAPIIAMPEAFKAVVEAQTGWSLENAWYVHVFPDAASPVGPNTAPGLSTAILFGLIGNSPAIPVRSQESPQPCSVHASGRGFVPNVHAQIQPSDEHIPPAFPPSLRRPHVRVPLMGAVERSHNTDVVHHTRALQTVERAADNGSGQVHSPVNNLRPKPARRRPPEKTVARDTVPSQNRLRSEEAGQGLRALLIAFILSAAFSAALSLIIGPQEFMKIIYMTPQGLALVGRGLMTYWLVYPATGSELAAVFAAILFNNTVSLDELEETAYEFFTNTAHMA
ncbi:MAG: glycosyltransferase 87 family protein, partial [Candidatus Caldarchaeum sp.]